MGKYVGWEAPESADPEFEDYWEDVVESDCDEEHILEVIRRRNEEAASRQAAAAKEGA